MLNITDGETIILHKYSGTTYDSRGQKVVNYTNIELDNVAVFAGTSREIEDASGTRVSTGKVLVTEENIEISSNDEITVQGTRYKVDGDSSGHRVNPLTGDSFGTRIQLRRTHA